MAEGTRSGKRKQRSDAREKRRALAAKPFEELDEAAGAEQSGGGGRSTLKQAAATAVAGALAAGVGGAVKALSDRREKPEQRERPEPEPSEEADPEPRDAQPQDTEPQAAAEQDQGEEQHEQDEQPEEQHEQDEQPEEQAEEASGVSMNEAKEIVAEAKRELEELLGAEVESVSGFHHSNSRWAVTLEVVTLRRVPETTDVLSSYEVEFDDDRNLVGISENRRYLRSQVQEG
jgi:flagellar motor protein MotB